MEWIKVFASAEDAKSKLQPNKPQLLIVDGVRICIVLRNERFFAVEDACPHNGQSLSKGNVNHFGELICPLHAYRFQLKTGRETEERCRDLKIYPIQAGEDGISVGI
jgi:nitrite reductase/ring-hydroxylating ferredoxin subunit